MGLLYIYIILIYLFLNIGVTEIIKEIVQQAEEDGLESVRTGEHVVLPDPRQAPSPVEPDFPMLHPSTVLAYTAAVTKTLKIGTGIVLIAQRNPLVLAKEMASLDVLSGGRLILGIGSGYLHQEFEALFPISRTRRTNG